LPKASAVARLGDWCAIPFAAYAASRVGRRGLRIIALAAGAALIASCVAAGLQSYGIWPNSTTMEHLSLGWVKAERVYEAVAGTKRFMGGGLLFHRLKFAHITGLGVLVAIVLAARASERWERRVAGAVALAGFLSVAWFPFARAAFIDLALSAVLALLLAYPGRRLAWLGIVFVPLAVAGTLIASPGLRERMETSLTSESNGDRTALWSTGLAAVKAHPFTGLGAGRFRPGLFADASTPPDVVEHPGKSHDQFLTIAAETGLIGLALFLVMLVALLRAMDPGSAQAAIGKSCLAFFALLSLLHDPLYHAPFSMALALCLGLALQRPRDGAAPTLAS
jgi:O-antigen ligase